MLESRIPVAEASRAKRRAALFMTPADRLRKMRIIYRAIAMLAVDAEDSTIASKLEYWHPWVRLQNPELKGIKQALASLEQYALDLELEVRQAVLDKQKESRCHQ
jgi:hypothetical protein